MVKKRGWFSVNSNRGYQFLATSWGTTANEDLGKPSPQTLRYTIVTKKAKGMAI